MQQQQARPPTNHNYPDAALGLRGNAPFPEADITFCHQYSTHVYDDNGREHLAEHVVVPFFANLSSEDEAFHSDSDADDSSSSSREPADYAYWLIRHIRDCQFGYVWHGRLLRRLPTSDGSLKWGIESTEVAVKEMQFHEIRNHNGRDDPETEVRAMQFLQRHIAPDEDMEGLSSEQVIQHKLQAMMDRGVVTSIDSLQNETSIFVVMPFCDGGDFLDFLLARKVNLTEPQLRLWFNQFLTGIETLQSAGICHRDISFENVVMKNTTDGVGSCALVIDLGMCLRIPYIEVNGERRRCLLQRQRRVGKVSSAQFSLADFIQAGNESYFLSLFAFT